MKNEKKKKSKRLCSNFWRTLKMVSISFLCFVFIASIVTAGYKMYYSKAYPIKYEESVRISSRRHAVEPALIYAMIKTESGFRNGAKSRVGARGLMQLMPQTFTWLQESKHELLSEDSINDPQINIEYGVYYISMLLQKYADEKTAICAYNAGPSTVDRWLNDKECSRDGKSLQNVPFDETRNYVNKVMKYRKIYRDLYPEKNL